MSSWRSTTLGDLVSLQRGHDLPQGQRVGGSVPVVGSGGIAGWHNIAKVAGPGVTLGRAANLGIPTLIGQDFWPLNTTLYVTDFRGNDVRFIYHLFQTLDLSGYNSGSVQPMLNRNFIKDVPVTVPAPAEQRRISETLGALDDKMAANDRITASADALRSALVQGAQVKRPDNFLTQPLSQVADFINGRAFTKDATGSGRMVVRIAEINSGPGPSTVYNEIAVDEKNLARPGDILFSWSGSLTVARWFRPEAIINQHIFKVIPRGDNPAWLAFEAVKSKLADFRAIAADKATTMGHIQRRHLDEEVVVPIPTAIDRLDLQAGSLWQRALAAEQENLTLAALRDNLLPELMSGRLRVREAENLIGEAV